MSGMYIWDSKQSQRRESRLSNNLKIESFRLIVMEKWSSKVKEQNCARIYGAGQKKFSDEKSIFQRHLALTSSNKHWILSYKCPKFRAFSFDRSRATPFLSSVVIHTSEWRKFLNQRAKIVNDVKPMIDCCDSQSPKLKTITKPREFAKTNKFSNTLARE